MFSRALLMSTTALIATSFALPSLAQDPSANTQLAAADAPAQPIETITVTAQRLNEARTGIETQTGASTYTITSAAIDATPGGDSTLLNQVILQAPDVAQDSFGQFHVRGDHADIQYRIDGIILPDGISVFGQTLSPRLIDSMKLVTGVVPAEYGLRTAGIIDITTKSGALEPGGEISMYGGSHNELNPSAEYGGTSGQFTYFFSGDYLSNGLGIESPDGRSNPIHDDTKQYHAFGYLEDILNQDNRLAVIFGVSHDQFQIPDQAGLQPSLGLNVNGQTAFASANLNENQREVTDFASVSLQHSAGDLDLQSSFVTRYSSLYYTPDPNLGDLLFNGISQVAYKNDVSFGFQTDAAYHINDSHTLRTGFYIQTDKATSDTSAQVLATDADGNQLTNQPETVIDNGKQTQWIESVYLQDEWKIFPTLTLNYGVRFDNFTAYTSGNQLSPRVNVLWQPEDGTSIHVGYARYFSPPPFELVGSETINKFANTTTAPEVTTNDPVQAERSNYFDVGVEQKIAGMLTLGADGYYKRSRDLIDEGQFGAPIILTPFNYLDGTQYGLELSANLTTGPFSAYGNLAFQLAKGKDIVSSEFNFGADDLAYIASHYINLDHEQKVTGSAGVSYLYQDTRLSADVLVGSGLRADLQLPDGSSIPNGAHLPYYEQVNLGLTHSFQLTSTTKVEARFDIINLFDDIYEIRNGTGIGVGAPQYGPRRGVFGGLALKF